MKNPFHFLSRLHLCSIFILDIDTNRKSLYLDGQFNITTSLINIHKII